ncbi:MAG TPA: hypothetical protein VGH21_02760, partial [Solirubrobacteraceae bacterium]
QGTPLVLLIAGAGEASDAPPQATFTGGLVGLGEVQARVIGDTTYRYEQNAASIDGGRPWVRAASKASEGDGLDPGGILENDQSGKQGTFSKLIEELGTATSIEESGPVTVDDQRVTEFDATLDPAPFLAKLQTQSKQSAHPLNSPFQLPSVGGSRSKPPPPSAPPSLKLELFIAPNGLPVRARITLAAEGTIISVRVDTLAINVPVHVQAPAARQTIDEASLKRIERRRAARELKHALHACRHVRGKAASRCRAFAHLKSASGSSESSALL